MSDLIPFDPKQHKPIQTVGNRYATEYLASEKSPEGKAWNIPQIWFDPKTKQAKTNKPKIFEEEKVTKINKTKPKKIDEPILKLDEE